VDALRLSTLRMSKAEGLSSLFGSGLSGLPAIGRLLTAWRSSQHAGTVVEALGDSIRATELHRDTFFVTRAAVIELLKQESVEGQSAIALADRWLVQGDFLLTPLEGQFDFVCYREPSLCSTRVDSSTGAG
jgi:hypothetical protein